jgi:hypothetical protein
MAKVKDYRPISSLTVLSRALELVMRDQISVRPGHSTTTEIGILVELERQFLTILVLLKLDFSKSFDNIKHVSKITQFFQFFWICCSVGSAMDHSQLFL